MLEYPSGRAINLETSRAVVSLDRLCFRAHDAMCESQGVSSSHVSTVLGPKVLEQDFAQDLATMDSLPTSVREPLRAGIPVREVASLLQKAGQPDRDSGELSWSCWRT